MNIVEEYMIEEENDQDEGENEILTIIITFNNK